MLTKILSESAGPSRQSLFSAPNMRWHAVSFVLWTWLVCSSACRFKSLKNWAVNRLRQLETKYKAPACNLLSAGRNDSSFNNSLVQVFLFHKDEDELLPDWLQYHAYLFGPSNIHVLDHDSQSINMCRLLAMYGQCGTHVKTVTADFELKHELLTKAMKGRKDQFLVPLDADEFLVIAEHHDDGRMQLLPDRDKIAKLFSALPIDGRKYKYNNTILVRHSLEDCNKSVSEPDQAPKQVRRIVQSGYIEGNYSSTMDNMGKTYYFSEGFIKTDQGNHFGLVENDHGLFKTKVNMTAHFHRSALSLLHVQAPSYNRMAMKFIRGAEAYGYNDTSNCAWAATKRGGSRYCSGAKEFRARSVASQQMFLEYCAAKDRSSSNADLVAWFAENALSWKVLLSA